MYRMMVFPPMRRVFIQLLGAQVGKGTVIHSAKFINLYRTGFRGLRIGKDCFVGNEVLIDLAGEVVLEDQVTLATRTMILSHMNVGYHDHPLQSCFPSIQATTQIGSGAFIGAGVIVLAGVTIGECSFVAAGSVVNKDVPPRKLAGGVPVRVIRPIEQENAPGLQ